MMNPAQLLVTCVRLCLSCCCCGLKPRGFNFTTVLTGAGSAVRCVLPSEWAQDLQCYLRQPTWLQRHITCTPVS